MWGLGQRPNRSTGDHSKGITNKGAGSEASLPVTLRSRRSAPKRRIRPLAYCRAKWARPNCWYFRHSCSFLQAGDFASAEATRGQWKRTKFAVAPLTPSPCTFSYLIFIVAGGIAPAGATRGLSDRPLDPFGSHYRSWFLSLQGELHPQHRSENHYRDSKRLSPLTSPSPSPSA